MLNVVGIGLRPVRRLHWGSQNRPQQVRSLKGPKRQGLFNNTPHRYARAQAVWGSNIPRIVEDIPRRWVSVWVHQLPTPGSSSLSTDSELSTRSRLHRNLLPSLNDGSRQLYEFLFPDGILAPAPWTSYAMVALLAGLFIELSMRFLALITKVLKGLARSHACTALPGNTASCVMAG